MITIDLSGFEELAKQFDGLAQELRDELIAKATLEAARAVETELLARTPINTTAYNEGSDALSPGELLADISVRPLEALPGNTTFAVGPSKKTAHVAKWVEYGHAMVTGGRRSVKNGRITGPGRLTTVNGTKITQVPAYPFLRPAQSASEGEALAAFEAVLKEAIEK